MGIDRREEPAVSADLHTVQFRGDGGLNLVGDQWNRDIGAAADRPTILMLHGGGQNRFSWKNTGQILADRGFHVIALDARGHGDSDRAPDAKYSIHALARDVAAVLEQIGRQVMIIGASMGGMTGILAARSAGPNRVTGLVLVDVVPRFESEGTSRIRDFMTGHVHGFETLEQAADAIAAYLPHRRRPRNLEGLKKNLRHRDGRWHWHWDPAFVTSAHDEPFADIAELEQASAELQVPILLIRGKLSDVVSPEGVEDFLSKVPQAEFVELSDAGHTAAGDDNDAFSDAVVSFLTR
jgi:pimeloyl-ACP methyl ester carboxylesterase